MRKKLSLLLSLFLCGSLASTGLYAAGTDEGSQSASGGAITNSTDVIKIAGRYTVKESWANPKTASEMGITSFNESPTLAAPLLRRCLVNNQQKSYLSDKSTRGFRTRST